jgi:hypothetical protein
MVFRMAELSKRCSVFQTDSTTLDLVFQVRSTVEKALLAAAPVITVAAGAPLSQEAQACLDAAVGAPMELVAQPWEEFPAYEGEADVSMVLGGSR